MKSTYLSSPVLVKFIELKSQSLIKSTYSAVFNTRDFWKILKVDFAQIFATDFDDIKTVNGHHSDAQTVLISSKSVAEIARKIAFEIRKSSY